jgi:branched-chain amino acid transport system permease protein
VWGAAALVLVPTWADDASKALSLSANVQANLALAIYGVVLIGVMLAAPGGIQGALRGVGGLLQGFGEPRSRGPAPRAKEEERS